MFDFAARTQWWRSDEFRRFLPYLKDAGHSVKHGHTRFELLTHSIPVRHEALRFEGECVGCGSTIHPFRMRHGSGGIYLAFTCEQGASTFCSRGGDKPGGER